MPDAVIVPGRMFGPAGGMLLYAGAVAEHRGAALHRHGWPSNPPPGDQPETEAWVCRGVAAAVDLVKGKPLLIGKSLGSQAARLAADRALPAVWLTPLLPLPWVAEALSRAEAPFLLVGGTADPTWDGAAAARLTPHVLEVDGADHGLFVPGPVSETVAALGRVVAAIDAFIATEVWRA